MNAPDKAVATAPANELRQLLNSDAMRKQLAMALPKILPLERFLRVLFTTMNRTPDLALCTRESVLAGVMTAASLGMEIDPALGRFYLIPFKNRKKGVMEAQAVIGYKGYIDLFYRSGQAAGILAEAVYEKDHFVYRLGLESKLEHIPSEEENRGALKYAYAVATLANGGKVWKMLNRSQIMKAKAYNRSSDSEYSPWKTSEPEMWAKTAIRALSDFMPLSAELREAVSVDAAQEQLAYATAIDVPAVVSETTEEPAAIEAPAVADQAPLTPRQRVNALMVQCGQSGLSEAVQKIIEAAGGNLQKLGDDELAKLGDRLSLELRTSQEG